MSNEVIQERLSLGEHAGVLVDLLNNRVNEVLAAGLVVGGGDSGFYSATPISLEGYDSDIIDKLAFSVDQEDKSYISAHNHPIFLDVVYEYFITRILDDEERGKLAYIFHGIEHKKHDWVYYFNGKSDSKFAIIPIQKPSEFIENIICKVNGLHKAFRNLYLGEGKVFTPEIEGPKTNFNDLMGNIINKMCMRLSTLKFQLLNE